MSPEVIAAIIAAAISVLTLVGTLATQYLGRRATSRDTEKTLEEQRKHLDRTLAEQGRQLDRTLAEQRTRTLNERFATAADQLGSDKSAAVRLAGVYAMAGLADDWEANRQTCVDVLCAYLRMPYESNPGEDAAEPDRLAFRASREVRHTVIRVIGAHLKDGAAVSWQGLDFDFTGVVFDGGDFSGARFSGGTVTFFGASFPGNDTDEVVFDDAEFSGGDVSFAGAKFSGGAVTFFRAVFSGGSISFDDAKFTDGQVTFGDAQFSGGDVSFDLAKFSGGTVSFGSEFSGATVSFELAQFSAGMLNLAGAGFSGSSVSFGGADLSGGDIAFDEAEFSGGEVIFDEAEFSDGTMSFEHAKFSGGTVNFEHAKFSGAEVNFSDADDWSHPPKFDSQGTSPAGVKLPATKGGDRPGHIGGTPP
jgi:uncharacterized protein YjbI with pentapeptide repeats